MTLKQKQTGISIMIGIILIGVLISNGGLMLKAQLAQDIGFSILMASALAGLILYLWPKSDIK